MYFLRACTAVWNPSLCFCKAGKCNSSKASSSLRNHRGAEGSECIIFGLLHTSMEAKRVSEDRQPVRLQAFQLLSAKVGSAGGEPEQPMRTRSLSLHSWSSLLRHESSTDGEIQGVQPPLCAKSTRAEEALREGLYGLLAYSALY